jgi:predicted dehydrogenase
MGLTHLAILNRHPAIVSMAVADSSSFMVRQVAKELSVPAFTDYRELLERCRPDFLVVATPTTSHAEIAATALRQGVHLFVEKPLTLSARDSEALTKEAADRRLVAHVGYVNRFNEIFGQVKQLLHANTLGELYHVACEVRSPLVLRAESGWRAKQTEGGGCLYDLASHAIDLMNYLVGPPTTILGGSLQSVVSTEVEDCVSAIFGYNGFSGTLYVDWSDASCRKASYRIEIKGTKGRIVADQHAYKVFTRSTAGKDAHNAWSTVNITDIARPVRMYLRGNEFTRQLDCFIECVMRRSNNGTSTFETATQVDQIIEKIRQCAHQVSAK